MSKLRRKAAYNVFNNICLPVAGLFKGQLYGLGELFMGFPKFCFERDPCFLDRRKMIPGLDGHSEISCLVEDVIGLGDILRV